MSEPKAAESTMRKGHCPDCGANRWADIVGSDVEKGEDDHAQIWWQTDYYILRCRGCESRYFQKEHVFSEGMDHFFNEMTQEWEAHLPSKIDHYPAPSKRAEPSWTGRISFEDSSLGSLLSDVYGCLNADLSVPAAISIRTCFDRSSEVLGIDPAKSFGEKLVELEGLGKIGKDEVAILETLTDAGSAAAHRGWRPSPSELATMMDIIESFLHRAFVLPKAAQKLKAGVPAKPKRTKKPKNQTSKKPNP